MYNFERRVRRQHHRVVTEELGQSLDTYDSSLTLIAIVYDALRGEHCHVPPIRRHNDRSAGHCGAWTKVGVLHRDASDGNILDFIDQETETEKTVIRGLLIDWDLCKYKEEMGQGATQGGRSVSVVSGVCLVEC